MARAPKATIRHREQQAVALHLAGKKFDEIAEIVGYSDRGAAYNATMRAIKRETVEDIGEIRNVEIVRIDAMLDSVWACCDRGPRVDPSIRRRQKGRAAEGR